jgi:hypothetical protein
VIEIALFSPSHVINLPMNMQHQTRRAVRQNEFLGGALIYLASHTRYDNNGARQITTFSPAACQRVAS